MLKLESYIVKLTDPRTNLLKDLVVMNCLYIPLLTHQILIKLKEKYATKFI